MMAPVFLLNPASALGRVFPARPLPETGEDGAIYVAKGTATHHMPMIVGPTSNLGVENKDQLGCGLRQPCAYGFPDVIQEGLHILLRWLNEQFPVRVPAHVLSEKIEARGHVRDERFHRREFQPAFAQKAFDPRLDLLQQLFRSAGDHEIIRISDEVHTGVSPTQGLERPLLRVVLPEKLFQSVQRVICQRRGSDAALRSSFRGFVKNVLLHM